MKFIEWILGVSLLCAACEQSRVLENPLCEKWETLYVTRVELTDTATVLSIVACGRNGDWFNLEGDQQGEIYLFGRESGCKYKYRGSSDFEVGKRYVFGESGNVHMTLRFEPLLNEERAIDVITDRSEALCVRGVTLVVPDSLRHLPVCHLRGEVEGNPDTKALLLWRWLDHDHSWRNMEKVRIIPVIDWHFKCDLPVGQKDDYYMLIPWNEWARASWSNILFFAEAGDLEIRWSGEDIPVIQGGELNRIAREADLYDQSVKNKYYPLISQMTAGDKHILPEVKAIYDKMRAETDHEEQMKLYRMLNSLSEEQQYVPEYIALTERFRRALANQEDSLLKVVRSDMQLAYLPWLFAKMRQTTVYDEELQQIAEAYGTYFKEYALGKRMLEKVEAARTNVGGKYIDFEAPDRNGNMYRFSEMIEGSRVVVLDLWASWCGGCRITSMSMKPLYKKYRDKGFTIVSVAREFHDLNALDRAVEMDGYEWPVLVELDDRIALWRTYNIGDGGGCVLLIDPATKKILARMPSLAEIESSINEYCK